jgi:transposase
MTYHSTKAAGIDTGKYELHVCLLPGEERLTLANSPEGIALLVERLKRARIKRVAIEATSIYHRACARALARARIKVAVAQPRQARAFAEALLEWSKADAIDAYVLARFAQVFDTPRPVADAKLEALAEVMTYVEQLEERIVWLKTSLERFQAERLVAAIRADIKTLEKRRAAELRKLEARLRQDRRLGERLDLLLSIPCVAERTALSLLIRMPELGTMTRQQAARLAGLAPCLYESGKFKGERHIYGGRARLRKALYMAAFTGACRWNRDLQTFYKRLLARGKAHTAAVTACSRKLVILANAILARATPWQPREVMP